MEKKDKYQWPLVSIVITSYNRANLIEKAIISALAQDYPNLEVIISDNCSTDNTDEVIKRYTNDPRIKYFTNVSNIGMIPNFIKATSELAKGKYISFVSSDDYLVNDSFISEAIERVRQYPEISVITSINVCNDTRSNHTYMDGSYPFYKRIFFNKQVVSGKEVFLKFPECHSISYGGTLLDREKLVQLDTSAAVPISFDVQNILQLILIGDVSFIDKRTYVARRHEENATSIVSKAETYIDNLGYIDIPYHYALENKLLDKPTLDNWRTDMYLYFCAQCMRMYYRNYRKEYNIFAKYLREKHPLVYKKITGKLDWATYRLLFAKKPIGNAYLNSRSYLGKIKRRLKSGK